MKKTSLLKTGLILLASVLYLAPISGFAQEQKAKKNQRKQPDFASMTPEERMDWINGQIERTVVRYEKEMGDKAPTAEQQETFTQLIAKNYLEGIKLRSEMMKARQKKKGNNRELMMEMMSKREKLDSELTKEMKGLLEKPQFKAFKKAQEKIQPKPQRRGQGGGGGGRGPGGGGGGGGGR
ncbi:hypothetical protein [Pelagicoccus mobilis]|uniref:LTXXQ motif family protein n=1 Tax=Pelagicoccus mobilis TaxID=415221 RepID=A0A934RUC0_9BACT|nr:hypothetical protein [Pelagicoccus mobilis]MBK1876568.1 hypothetical protein [Pelagicoccus mobilis]